MNTYIVTSDRYRWLVPGCVHYYQRIMEHPPIVLCYDDTGLEGFCTVSLGMETKHWTTGLRDFFIRKKEKYFLLMLEDYYLQDVDMVAFNEAVKLMEGGAAKVDLSGDRMNFPHSKHSERIVLSGQNAKYRASLQAALWSREYFLKCCEPALTAWEFELKGNVERINDGALIYGVRKPCMKYLNMMRKGVWYARRDFK